MQISSSQKLSNSLSGLSPDVTLPTDREPEGRGPAVMYADVSKSMLLHERLGDRAARVVIDRLLALTTKAVRAHGGRVVKTIGDEILAVLPSADAAARAACDLLLEVDQCKPQAGVVIGMHVGFHAGAFGERDGDITGDAVNIAKRLTAYARPGQILTTSISAGAISPLVRRSMRRLGALDIRGRPGEMEVEEIAWHETDAEDSTDTELMLRTAHSARARLVLTLGYRQWIVGPQARHLSIGRDPNADIVVAATQASRNHGFIEYHNSGFFYTDTSLNGSYVSFGDSSESLYRRNQVLLSGQGGICFGHTAREPGDRLTFRIDPP